MSLRLPLLLLVAVLSAAGLTLVRPVEAAAPSRVFITATEHHLALSRSTVKAGTLIVQMRNQGEDLHDVQLVRLSRAGRATGRRYRMRTLAPGQLGELTLRVRAGRYRLTCTIAGHARMGMRATLRVR